MTTPFSMSKIGATKPQTLLKEGPQKQGNEHYTAMPIQPWDVVDTWPKEQRIGFYRGNLLKYTMRLGNKDENSAEAKKAKAYADKLEATLKEP